MVERILLPSSLQWAFRDMPVMHIHSCMPHWTSCWPSTRLVSDCAACCTKLEPSVTTLQTHEAIESCLRAVC